MKDRVWKKKPTSEKKRQKSLSVCEQVVIGNSINYSGFIAALTPRQKGSSVTKANLNATRILGIVNRVAKPLWRTMSYT